MSETECADDLIELVDDDDLEDPTVVDPELVASPSWFSAAAPIPRFPIDAPAYPGRAPETHAAPIMAPAVGIEVATESTEARVTMPVIWTKKPQFEPTPREQRDVQTHYMKRQQSLIALLKQLAVPMALLLVGGIALGATIRMATRARKHASSSPFAPPKLAARPALNVEPIITAGLAAKPKLIDVRLESTPAGATATLISNGVTTPLGSTPVVASIDATRSYDVIFAIAGRPPKIEHLDPNATHRIAVTLAERALPAARAAAPMLHVAAAATPHGAHASRATRASVVAAVATKPDPTAEVAITTGTLSISTTTACSILIDGKNSGLTTPQSAISLPAGHHTVRLIAAPAHINKLVAVDIEPRRTTNLIQNFSRR